MSRRPLKPWEVIATLLTAGQLRIQPRDPISGEDMGATFAATEHARPIIICLRTGKEITLANVKTIQAEHWPVRHVHDGPVSPDNTVLSLAEGHKIQTAREKKADRKERRLKIARLAKSEVELRIGREPKWRLKKKMDGSVVKVRTR